MSTVYFDENPARYVKYYWDRALSWWDTQKDSVQETYDMAMGWDQYMQDKGKMGFSNLTPPLIYVVTEARVATLWEMLSREEPFFRVDPIDGSDALQRIAAERKQSALQNLRRDLEWDDQIFDLFMATEYSNYCWTAIEPVMKQIGPNLGLLAERELYGTEKMYQTWRVLSPGQVLIDGFHQHEDQLPAKFKVAFMPYHELKTKYPKYVDSGIIQYAKRRDDSAYYNPNERQEQNDDGGSTVYQMFDHDGGGGSWESDKGFLVAEAHLNACMKDGSIKKLIYTFLPEVKNDPKERAGGYPYGYPLCEPEGTPFPFESISDLVGIARGRRVPYTMTGKSTADLLVSMQREFSDTIASERDLDRMYLQPPIAVRAQLLAGLEQPSFGSGEVWSFVDKDWSRNMPLEALYSVMNVQTPNRNYTQNTRQEMKALIELIGAAMEASTGAATGPDEKVGIFQARARGGAGRINLVFQQHARTLIRIAATIMSVMAETASESLYPHIKARSETYGRDTALTQQDIMTPSKLGIPALSEYANREMAKYMWQATGAALLAIPAFQQAPEAGILLTEDIIRSQSVSEERTQQYTAAVRMAVQQAQMAQMAATLAPQITTGEGNAQGPTNEPIPSQGPPELGPGGAIPA